MDRFIGDLSEMTTEKPIKFKIQYGQIYRLKQRLIYKGSLVFKIQYGQIYSALPVSSNETFQYLKSSMDRFIEFLKDAISRPYVPFKIQYGQIYSVA